MAQVRLKELHLDLSVLSCLLSWASFLSVVVNGHYQPQIYVLPPPSSTERELLSPEGSKRNVSWNWVSVPGGPTWVTCSSRGHVHGHGRS